ncbi:MAG: CotH kinase family protein [Prevotella sp.]|nr:CotH kinase family protein [Prevotella sp.]
MPVTKHIRFVFYQVIRTASSKHNYAKWRDAYWWKEEYYFSTNYFEPYKGYRWTWKYPDEEDVTPEQENYIKNYINQAEESIKNGTYEKYIDVMSFARWMLAHDIMGTWDSGGSNLYVMKYDNTENSLLQMANMWDFDTIFNVGEYRFSNYHNGDYDFYYPALFNSSNKTFVKTYKQLWDEIKPTLLEQLTDFINQYAVSEEAKALQLSREQYSKRWNYEVDSVDKNAQDAIAWFSTHLKFLDEAISQLNTETSIQNIHSDKDTDQQMYNLSGTKVNATNKNKIVIKGHKKYIYK